MDILKFVKTKISYVIIVSLPSVIIILLFSFLTGVWLLKNYTYDIKVNVPGMDDPYGFKEAYEIELVSKESSFKINHQILCDIQPDEKLKGFWPNFRGPDFDNINKEDIKLLSFLPEGGIKLLWSVKVGAGYASVAVYKGRVFILDYIEEGNMKGDMLRCFSLKDGKEIWRTGYYLDIPLNHGRTRTTPAVSDKYVVSLGPMGHVMCVDFNTGKFRWGVDLQKQYGTRNLSKCWYAGQNPFIDGEYTVIAPAGSNVLIMAVSCKTGEILWQVPNEDGWNMSHSSIIPAVIDGVKMYIYAAIGGIIGIGAEGKLSGKVLWKTKEWTTSTVMPSPVVMSNGYIFVSSGYNGGSALIKLNKIEDQRFEACILWNFIGKNNATKCFSTYQHTAIYYSGMLFGIQLNDAKEHKMEFVCVDPFQIAGGKFIWYSGPEMIFGTKKNQKGWSPYIMADNKFFVISDFGKLVVFKADINECKILWYTQLINGEEIWAPLVITGGKLFVRNDEELYCFDIAESSYE